TGLTHQQPGVTTLTYAWAFDAGDRLTQTMAPGQTINYGLDLTDQLTTATYQGGSQTNEAYQYDANGNRQGSFAVGADNRLGTYTLADGTNTVYTYSYDNEGNRTGRTKKVNGVAVEQTVYDWDYRNRLTHVKVTQVPSGTVTAEATYTYDVYDR